MDLNQIKRKLETEEEKLREAQAEKKMLLKKVKEEGYKNIDSLIKREGELIKLINEKEIVFNNKLKEFTEKFGDKLDGY